MRSLAGHLLVASPQLPDENFYRTVVLIIHHDQQGAIGVVLNRPTGSTVREVWESLSDEPCQSDESINVGGPVSGPLLAIHTNAHCSESEFLPGVFFATHRDRLNRIVREPDLPFRIYNGYSGWAPGQLESELKQGGWISQRDGQNWSGHHFGCRSRMCNLYHPDRRERRVPIHSAQPWGTADSSH